MAIKVKLFGTFTISTLLAMALGEIMPDPSDAFHFIFVLPWLLHNSAVAPHWLVAFVAFADWYLLSFSWYMIVAVIAIGLHEWGYEWSKVSLMTIGLLSLGFVIGTLARFIFTGTWI